ncbi:MAG: hypothetical protein F4Y80_09025 [Caldilineaceae bacterium SB0665_bin_21]|nr:hypothetical protein [Caldilineaceae bacterium SB0665_bin_21]
MLARYGQVFPASDTGPSESEEVREELQQRLCRRRQLVDQRVQERNRLDKGVGTVAGRSTRRQLAWLNQEIARLDKEYQALLQRSGFLRPQPRDTAVYPGDSLAAALLMVRRGTPWLPQEEWPSEPAIA